MQILKDGPIIIEGPLVVNDADNKEVGSMGGNVALCRCGQSANKPFCDGSHVKADFKSDNFTVILIRK